MNETISGNISNVNIKQWRKQTSIKRHMFLLSNSRYTICSNLHEANRLNFVREYVSGYPETHTRLNYERSPNESLITATHWFSIVIASVHVKCLADKNVGFGKYGAKSLNVFVTMKKHCWMLFEQTPLKRWYSCSLGKFRAALITPEKFTDDFVINVTAAVFQDWSNFDLDLVKATWTL